MILRLLSFYFSAFLNFIRSSGPVVQWSSGPGVQWSSGPVVQWSSGPVVQWSSGPVVQCPVGAKGLLFITMFFLVCLFYKISTQLIRIFNKEILAYENKVVVCK